MTANYTQTADGGWGATESVIFGAALVGFAAMWLLFVTVHPDELVSPYGMAISLVAGAYLSVLVFSYLK